MNLVHMPTIRRVGIATGVLAVASLGGFQWLAHANADPVMKASAIAPAARQQTLLQYCSGCHNDRLKTGGMSVQGLHPDNLLADDDTWEKILKKLSLGEMPPKGRPRPSPEQVADFTTWLRTSLDQQAVLHPNPGRVGLRRMNRVEYANAVRDLLGLNVDVSKELPVDDTGYGFDNIADVLTVSPTLMNRYVHVAGQIASLATGEASRNPSVTDYKIPKDDFTAHFGVPAYNERASDDLPLDSRGGGSFQYYAPYDGTYTIQVHLNPGTSSDIEIDANNRYDVTLPLKAGLRTIGVSFHKTLALDETLVPWTIAMGPPPLPKTKPVPIPMDVQVDGALVKEIPVPSMASGPAFSQAFYPRDVLQISVVGPTDITGPGSTASRKKIFICHPSASLSETACAHKILTVLATHAYRRPVTEADIGPLMKMYDEGRDGADFEHGIEAAVEAVLVSPDFLFMRETDPANAKPGSVHRISDVELATRLSFFLWSSLPDDELVSLGERGQLHKPAVLKREVARMLADPRSKAFTENFAGQWLYLRRLEFQKPDKDNYPNYDVRLRSAELTETQMFFDSVVHENRSVLDFLNADYTFLNQRLAEHYGIPGIYGTAFRRVKLDPAWHRGGLLGQGAILTVTSYNNRTSVVLRGKWILENLLNDGPPPPPPNVPSLNDAKNGKTLTVREQMEEHHKNPICAACHTRMDPLGFSLENYDATGGWRNGYAGQLVDASAEMPDGTKFNGPSGLQGYLMTRKDQFVEAFIEKLMTYALGRGVEAYDMPTVRAIRYKAASDDYKMQTIIMDIIQSVPFEMRRTPDNDHHA
jgi:mono/diheme cytochrome c family protein